MHASYSGLEGGRTTRWDRCAIDRRRPKLHAPPRVARFVRCGSNDWSRTKSADMHVHTLQNATGMPYNEYYHIIIKHCSTESWRAHTIQRSIDHTTTRPGRLGFSFLPGRWVWPS